MWTLEGLRGLCPKKETRQRGGCAGRRRGERKGARGWKEYIERAAVKLWGKWREECTIEERTSVAWGEPSRDSSVRIQFPFHPTPLRKVTKDDIEP